jgi:hypothetical protein
MNNIQIIKQEPKKVLDALKLGEIERIEFAVEQITDEFMIYGLRGGLIDELSNSFPDPRKECEISIKQILSASIAGHFQDMYAISQSPYALHSPTLLAELGLNVKVLLEGEGISRKGTKDDTPFSGDVIRKKLDDMTAMELIQWYNRHVGRAYLEQSNYEPCIHILDCTKLEVNIENENYEGSGIVKEKEKDAKGKSVEKVKRGYKLGSLRSLLDDCGIITSIAFGAIQIHDLTLCHELLMTSPYLKPGDMVIEDRGFLDGKTISKLKKERKVDVTIPLRSDMLAYEDSLVTAYHLEENPCAKNRCDSGEWEKHPTREKQEIKFIEHADYMWEECSVPLIGCVVRELNKGKDGSGGRADYEHWVFVTTRLSLKGKQIIQTYELRPEIEEDHRQWKIGQWDMSKFTSTSMVQIVYHIIIVLLAYNLMKIYSNTQAGQKFAQKTLRRVRREQIRNHEVAMIVYTSDSYALFSAKYLVWLLLGLPKDVQERLKGHFDFT